MHAVTMSDIQAAQSPSAFMDTPERTTIPVRPFEPVDRTLHMAYYRLKK